MVDECLMRCRLPSPSGEMPIAIIHKALQSVPGLGKWTYDVHQYLDYFSTGNWVNDATRMQLPSRPLLHA